jgi:hypothetical protein
MNFDCASGADLAETLNLPAGGQLVDKVADELKTKSLQHPD